MLHDWHLVQIGTFGRATAPLDAALISVIGTTLPTSTSVVQHAGAHRLYRIAADQYWIVTPDAALSDKLSVAVPPSAGSVTRLSDARVRIAIEGTHGNGVARQGGVGRSADQSVPGWEFAQTGLHHVGVLLERLGPDRV